MFHVYHFLVLLAAALFVRCLWFAGQPFASDRARTILNETSFVLFYSAFSVFVGYWATLVHKRIKTTEKLIVCANVFLYGFLVFDVIVDIVSLGSTSYYDISMLTCSFMGVVMAAAIVYNGNLLSYMLIAVSERMQKQCNRIWWISRLCAVAFIIRCFTLSYRPITDGGMMTGLVGAIMYPAFFYPVPELLPTFTMLYLMSMQSPSTQSRASAGGTVSAQHVSLCDLVCGICFKRNGDSAKKTKNALTTKSSFRQTELGYAGDVEMSTSSRTSSIFSKEASDMTSESWAQI